MECEEIKKIIPQYFQHTASEEEIQAVEEHLCVCHDCRTVLGELMDKASSAEEISEAPSQEQAEPLTDEKVKPPLEEEKEEPPKEKPQEEVEEKKEEDMKYFPGEDLEASMDKVDDILGKTKPVKGDKEEEKVEDSSFEVISDSPSAVKQELPTESDIEALDTKDLEPVAEEIKEPEEKVELPLKGEKPEETTEGKEEVKKEEEASEPSSGTGIELKGEEPAAELKKESIPEEEVKSFLAEEEEKKESPEEVSYALDRAPLGSGKAGLLEYFCLIGGLAILGFLAYLFLKG